MGWDGRKHAKKNYEVNIKWKNTGSLCEWIIVHSQFTLLALENAAYKILVLRQLILDPI